MNDFLQKVSNLKMFEKFWIDIMRQKPQKVQQQLSKIKPKVNQFSPK